MARNWKEAQEREQAFWARIYLERKPDIPSYMPITHDIAVDWATKMLGRHRVEMAQLEGKTVADIGCGPYGVIYGIVHARRPFALPPVLIGVDPLIDFYISDIGLLRRDDRVKLYQALSATGGVSPFAPALPEPKTEG